MRHRFALLAAVMILICFAGTGCGSKANADLMLHLAFDEEGGTTAKDSAKKLQDAEVHYRFTHAAYTENMEPEWRKSGVTKGSLLFDGSSTWLEY
ncbi:MAG: hypothetical protein K2N94_00920, partial [Lachnospiraceae bacterium]|nr:hypothetical protein [Lachnospiraceae bacterium]